MEILIPKNIDSKKMFLLNNHFLRIVILQKIRVLDYALRSYVGKVPTYFIAPIGIVRKINFHVLINYGIKIVSNISFKLIKNI